MEMCAEFWSGADSSLYSYDDLAPARRLKYTYYPPELLASFTDKRLKIPPKMHNEVRVMSADIALMQSNKGGNNDATSIFINQLMLSEAGGRSLKNIIYTQNYEGLRADDQALVIRRFVAEYDIDYLVIDARGLGLPVLDLLMKDMYDQERGKLYCALGCINNKDIDDRCAVKNAPKKIWAVLGSPEFNSTCATTLREEFRQGNIRLLCDEDEFEELYSSISGFNKLDTATRLQFKLPYINTTLAINELINLETEIRGNYVRVKEKSGFRKDRFSSLSYNVYVSNIIENDYNANKNKKSMEDLVFEFGRKPSLTR